MDSRFRGGSRIFGFGAFCGCRIPVFIDGAARELRDAGFHRSRHADVHVQRDFLSRLRFCRRGRRRYRISFRWLRR